MILGTVFAGGFLHCGHHFSGTNRHVIWVPEDTRAFSVSSGAVIVMTARNSKAKQRK